MTESDSGSSWDSGSSSTDSSSSSSHDSPSWDGGSSSGSDWSSSPGSSGNDSGSDWSSSPGSSGGHTDTVERDGKHDDRRHHAPDFSLLLNLLFDETSTAARQPAASAFAADSEDEARRRAIFEATLKRLIASPAPARDDRSLLRRIVEAPRWFVPTTAGGGRANLPNDDAWLTRAFTRSFTRRGQRRRWKRDPRAPLRVLPVLAVDPGRPVRERTGRELARRLRTDLDGVIFVFEDGETVGVTRDELPLLAQIADALDLEAMLAAPGPGQVERLRAARWYVPKANGGLTPEKTGTLVRVAVYTHPDRLDPDERPALELDGATLFGRLARRDTYDGISVNPGIGLGDHDIRAPILGPWFAQGLVRGHDPRPGAAPLPARTRAEVELYLDLDGFPSAERELLDVSEPGGPLLLQARSPAFSSWRIVECSVEQPSRRGPHLSPVFAIDEPDAAPGELGTGRTQLLCAGRLAARLGKEAWWTPPRWRMSDHDRARAVRLGRWAFELAKLLPDDADTLPWLAARTAAGAYELRTSPRLASRAWIDELVVRYGTATRPRPWWWPFGR